MRLTLWIVLSLSVVLVLASLVRTPPPLPMPASDEDCVQCKHVDCIKGNLRRKQAMADGYDRIAAKYARGWLDRNGQSANEIDLGARYPDARARARAYLELREQYKAYAQDEDALSTAAGAPGGCPASSVVGPDGEGPSAATDIETCVITGLPAVMQDAPCARLGQLLASHEALHQQACEVRGQRKVALVDPVTGRNVRDIPALVLSPSGKAREEARAYRMEVAELQKLLKAAEKKCGLSFKGVKTSCTIPSPAGRIVMGQEITGRVCGNPVASEWTIHTVNYVVAPRIGTQRRVDPPWQSDCVAKGSAEERRRAAIYQAGPGKGWMCVYDAGDGGRRPTITIRVFRMPQCSPQTEQTITVVPERAECSDPSPSPSVVPVS